MGGKSSLPKRVTQKETCKGKAHGLEYAQSSMQGLRPTMEDAHQIKTEVLGHPKTAFFACLDGHAGPTVSRVASQVLLQAVLEAETYSQKKAAEDGRPPLEPAESLAVAMREGFINLDLNMRTTIPQLAQGIDTSGSTCVAAFVTPTHIVVANLGDSRAILCTSGQVRFSTNDHKPGSPEEQARIKAAGGFVIMGRVCGNLAVSRALGDYEFKDRADLPPDQQKIGSGADMTTIERKPDDQFLIVACDGIWDVMTNVQVLQFVTKYYNMGHSLAKVTNKLLDVCLKKGSTDNMTAVIVRLHAADARKSYPLTPDSASFLFVHVHARAHVCVCW